MNDIFITNIHVKQSRNISDFDIPLSQERRSHLILTGKNGSGKTSLLMDLHILLSEAMQEVRPLAIGIRAFNYSVPLSSDHLSIALFNQNDQHEVINTMIKNGAYIVAYFDAKRLSKMEIPTGIKKMYLKTKYLSNEIACKDFIQYIVNLKAERSFANDDNDIASSQKIDEWFVRFLQRLRKLFQSPELELEFDRKNYNFLLKENGKLPYTFNTLSDGFSALFMIVSEIIMRMEGQNAMGYDRQGIVLIDEIETHLHVSLQKEIMPLLIDFFPNIQFIVTTHSPFVISSIENAVICDLEQKTVANDLSAYSYSILTENYFDVDKYSTPIKEKITRVEYLCAHDRSQEEKAELKNIITYLYKIPQGALDTELTLKLQSFKLQYPKIFSGDTE